jgi:ankyrin repeat protein
VAAKSGYADVVEQLLKAGADINAQAYNNNTAMHLAQGGGHQKVIHTLKRWISERTED